jgi:hypothetical protein
MSKILNFNDFSSGKTNENLPTKGVGEGYDESIKHYMFFQNLHTIKHYIDEILALPAETVDAMLSDGHDWAADHVSTSKDDIEEVASWIRSESNQESPIGVDAEMISATPSGDVEKTELQMIEEPEEEEREREDEEGQEEDEDEE